MDGVRGIACFPGPGFHDVTLLGMIPTRMSPARMDAYICMAESLCCPPETYHNIVNQYQYKIVVFQSLSRVQLFATPWTAACQASLSFTIFQSLLKLMSIKSVMPSNHLILCCSFLLLRSIFHSIRVFSNELAFCIRWPKNWSISFSISPSTDGRKWQSTLIFLLGKSNGEKSLVGYSPCGCKESDTTE